jgi:hypothetical protein
MSRDSTASVKHLSEKCYQQQKSYVQEITQFTENVVSHYSDKR